MSGPARDPVASAPLLFALGFGSAVGLACGLLFARAEFSTLQLNTAPSVSAALSTQQVAANHALPRTLAVRSDSRGPSVSSRAALKPGSQLAPFSLAIPAVVPPMAVVGALGVALTWSMAAAWRTLSWQPARRPLLGTNTVISLAAATGEVAPRDDDILPDGVMDAIIRASQATTQAIREGKSRCIAEVNLENIYDVVSGPQFNEPGAAQRWLALNSDFLECFAAEGNYKVAAVLPDKRMATMVQAQFPNAGFSLFTLTTVTKEEMLAAGATAVVFVAPDAESVSRITTLADSLGPGMPAILFNPRIGDFSVAKKQSTQQFADTFITTYSMRYVRGTGAIYQCYPDPWKIFRDDPEVPGRYQLVTTTNRRPAIWELDYLMSTPPEGSDLPTLSLDSEEDKMEGAGVVGYSMLYLLSAVPIFIGIAVVAVLFVNSLK